MKKFYSKSKMLFVLVITLFAQTCFYSCDKPGKLEGTTWESNYFETKSKSGLFILRGDNIIISFEEHRVNVHFINTELETNNGGTFPGLEVIMSGVYTSKGKNLTIEFDEETAASSERIWTGKVSKTTMTLEVYAGTVKFKKR